MKIPEKESSPVGRDTAHEIRISQRAAARLLLASAAVLGFTFFAGYYWGKKSVAEQFLAQVDQEVLADKIYSSLCSLYDVSEEDRDEKERQS